MLANQCCSLDFSLICSVQTKLVLALCLTLFISEIDNENESKICELRGRDTESHGREAPLFEALLVF